MASLHIDLIMPSLSDFSEEDDNILEGKESMATR
jgi:hypothetical protein